MTITSIQCCTGVSSQSDTRKIISKKTEKEEIQLILWR